MKHILRVAMPEQYCYIESHFEGTAEEAVHEYRELVKKVNGGFGLDDKTWRKCLDSYLASGTMSVEHGEQLSKEQAFVIKEIDKSIARQNYVNSKGQPHHSLKQ